jgi:hypothetical protein
MVLATKIEFHELLHKTSRFVIASGCPIPKLQKRVHAQTLSNDPATILQFLGWRLAERNSGAHHHFGARPWPRRNGAQPPRDRWEHRQRWARRL